MKLYAAVLSNLVQEGVQLQVVNLPVFTLVVALADVPSAKYINTELLVQAVTNVLTKSLEDYNKSTSKSNFVSLEMYLDAVLNTERNRIEKQGNKHRFLEESIEMNLGFTFSGIASFQGGVLATTDLKMYIENAFEIPELLRYFYTFLWQSDDKVLASIQSCEVIFDSYGPLLDGGSFTPLQSSIEELRSNKFQMSIMALILVLPLVVPFLFLIFYFIRLKKKNASRRHDSLTLSNHTRLSTISQALLLSQNQSNSNAS